MAKRRKVEAPSAEKLEEIEQEFRRETLGKPNPTMAPISQVAADSARAQPVVPAEARVQHAHDAADAQRFRHASEEGRVIEALPLASIQPDVIVRDRTVMDPDEMAELKSSILANGVRLPIEVFARREGRYAYALISGFRRLQAVKELYAETQEARFEHVPALIRQPDTLGDSFAAMVEENEVRASLSHFERGRIAVLATQRNAFASTEQAVAKLFQSASKAKRSKIRSFALIFEELGDLLSHAEGLKERDGLRLAAVLKVGGSEPIRAALEASEVRSAEGEWTVLAPVVEQAEQQAKPAKTGRPKEPKPEVITDVALEDGLKIRAEKQGVGYVIHLQGRALAPDLIKKAIDQLQRTLAQSGS